MSDYQAFGQLLRDSRRIVGFTGAGISTEAGIADYRSQGGVWDRFVPVYLDEFIKDHDKRVLYWKRKQALYQSIKEAQPTTAHRFFTDLYRQGTMRGLITQNIDGLHEKSGFPSEGLVNLHGTTLEIICLDCNTIVPADPLMEQLDPADPPRCGDCGGLLKPNTISFGQQLVTADLVRAEKLARDCDLFIAAGSTLQVQPAASFPLIARESGARLVIITLSATPLDRYADFVFREKLGRFIQQLNC